MKNQDKTYKNQETYRNKKLHIKESKKNEITDEEYYKKWEDDRL